MKLLINGTKVRAFKGVDKNNRPYQFIVVGGRTEENGKAARAVFNNRWIYEAIASAAASILDCVRVEGETHEHSFTGRDGKTVTVSEAVDPTPVGLTKSQFPTTKKWPDWETLMKEAASAPASADAPAAAEAEAEF